MKDIQDILKEHWGYEAFRPLQEEIIRSILDKKDTLAVLPTGGGKSICFQVPALAQEGICIVISPLIALMKDQVENLRKRNIPALLIHSGMKRIDLVKTLENARQDYFKFLYVSPERLETSLFLEYLPALQVNLIAVDEAHCISQWGYDFRPSYLRIAALRKELPSVPVLALTASATPEVQQDICARLEFRQEHIFRQSFERQNLSYSAFRPEARTNRLLQILKKVEGTAIVYCRSRRRTSEVAELLRLHGLSASNYHAGLTTEERNNRQKDWIENRLRVMVCTNAFGMGIDKPDVRLVVHMDIPDCPENYYQEAGRAGRDGKKSYAVLLYEDKDLRELENAHIVRFPSLEKIRLVYNALVNFLQIPAYTGEYTSYSFQFEDFIRNFRLNASEALYALKALEGDGWLEFSEKNFSPSTLVFTTSKETLYTFQQSHPEHEMVLTTLLRNYGGIFDFPAFISESFLARLLQVDEAILTNQLHSIASFGIISYTPRNEEPRITFLRNRVPADDLLFNLQPYEKRKNIFIKRARMMSGYATTEGCRSRYISNYFGEAGAGDCGQCDNCLRRKATELSAEEFHRITCWIRQQLSDAPLTAKQLVEEQGMLGREKTWKVIEFLKAEEKIVADTKGILRMKEKE